MTTALILLALVNISLQIADWHTTSEILKRGGHETNDLLAPWFNDDVEHHVKFARIGLVKMVAAAGVALLAWLGTLHAVAGAVAVALLVWLAVRYAKVVKKNAQVLKRQKESSNERR